MGSMNKYFWFDCETTGTDPRVNEIIQIAGQVVIDNIIVDEFNIKMRPNKWDSVEAKALEVNGITVEELKEYPDRKIGYTKILNLLDKHINKFDKTDKMVPSGYNVGFDIDFLLEEFRKNKNNFLFSYLHGAKFDVLVMALMLEIKEKRQIFIPNRKLTTVAEVLGCPFEDAHDAMADIVGTRRVAGELWRRLFA